MRLLNSLLTRVRAHGERVNDRFFDRGAFLRHYKTLVTGSMSPTATVLHLGSGRGAIYSTWRLFGDPSRHRGRLIALDPDGSELRRNPLSRRVMADGEALPFGDQTIDLVVTEYVLEHLTNPERILAECHRVLRPAGQMIFTTPNKWSYVSVAARTTPLAFHYIVSKMRGTPPEVMYETYYRMNTVPRIKAAAESHRFRVKELRTFVGEPNYTLFAPGVHYLFVLLHKVMERVPPLRRFGLNIVGVLVKS